MQEQVGDESLRTSTPQDIGAAGAATADEAYAQRLNRLQNKWWKKVLDVQAPYRANLRRMRLGRTLDVGCGNGRNLGIPAGRAPSASTTTSTWCEAARERGCVAYTVEEFFADPELAAPGSFDSILAAHLVEHISRRTRASPCCGRTCRWSARAAGWC